MHESAWLFFMESDRYTPLPENAEFEHFGSLIILKGSDDCLGYLMDFGEHGVHDSTYGPVPVTSEQATAHNVALDKALVKGLDECAVGLTTPQPLYVVKGRTFNGPMDYFVQTFLGQVVASPENMKIRGSKKRNVTFLRNGKRYKGTWNPEEGDFLYITRMT